MNQASELVVVAMFSETVQAHLACSALRAAGIDALVLDEHGPTRQGWSDATFGVTVLVAAPDVGAAREVLGTEAVVSTRDDD
jgi:hypothetical protein